MFAILETSAGFQEMSGTLALLFMLPKAYKSTRELIFGRVNTDLKTKYAIVFAVFKKDFYKSTFQMRK